jgi:ATP-binding cassette, subfamily B, bacterial
MRMLKNLHLKEFLRVMKMMRKKLPLFIVLLVITSSIFSIHQILISFVNKDMINAVVKKDTHLLIRAVILAAVALGLACILDPMFYYIKERNTKQTINNIRQEVFSHVERLPAAYFETKHTGDLISRINNDVNVFEPVYTWQLSTLLTSVLWGVGSCIFMFLLSWQLTLLMMVLGLASAGVNLLFSAPLRKVGDSIQQSIGNLTQFLSDILAGFRVIKIFSISESILGKYLEENDRLQGYGNDRAKRNAQMNGLNYLLSTFSLIGVFIVGAFMTARGTIDFGTVIAIVTLQNGVAFLFINFGNFFSSLQGSLAGAARVFEILDEKLEPQVYSVEGAMQSKAMISLENITFGYDQRESVLNGLQLSVREGQVAALVGTSGGGKSTVIKLLLGFYAPGAGNISIAGKALGEYTLEELRAFMSYVPQDAYLFDGTVEENIGYGRPGAGREEVEAAAKAANAHDFILECKDGYDTRVGERGIRLSGGQRQRIAIARAILKDAPILLLDEATSSLDSESEQLVQQALNDLMRERTVVVVAHRLSTIEHADIICVIEDGRVVEQGTHEELLVRMGSYQKLHALQFRQDEPVELAG